MDIEKIISFVIQYLSDYWWFFSEILRRPNLKFQLLEPSEEMNLVPSSSSQLNTRFRRFRLDPKLLSFVCVSIFIGSTIMAIVPGRSTNSLNFTTILLATVAAWWFYSFVLYVLCKLAKGKGSFEETLGVALQLFSVIYVVSSVLAFLSGLIIVAVQANWPSTTTAASSGFSGFQPVSIYFFVEFVLLAIYLPIAVKFVHGFRWFRQLVIGCVTSVVFVSFSVLSYMFISIPCAGYLGPKPEPEIIPFPFEAFVETDPRIVSVVSGGCLGWLSGLIFVVWLIRYVVHSRRQKSN